MDLPPVNLKIVYNIVLFMICTEVEAGYDYDMNVCDRKRQIVEVYDSVGANK